MKITDVKTTVLRLPNVKPIGDGIQDLLVIEVITDDGIAGIGEVHTSPHIAQAVIEAPISHYAGRGLKEVILGRDPLDRETLWMDMYRFSAVYGRRGIAIHAISGIDIALWDILGKATGLPVHKLLGGAYRKKVRPYASLLMPKTQREAKAEVEKCLEHGFSAIKLGWGPLSGDLSVIQGLIEAVREAAGDDVDIMLDIGFGLTMKRAEELVQALEPFNIFFLEEPLSPDDLAGYAKLCSKTGIAIAAGEKETTYYGFRDLIKIGKVDIIQPDLARAGGFTECKKIADLAQKEGIMCIPHCWSSDILLSATLQLAACIQDLPYVEFCTLETPLRTGVTERHIKVTDGIIEIPDSPGIGVELNRETIEKYRYESNV